MPEMSEIPEGRPPATAPASASPAERRRRRRAFWERVYLVACVVGAAALLILRPRLADDQARSAALGGAIGLLAAAIVLILLLVRGRRGHDTMLPRDGRRVGRAGQGGQAEDVGGRRQDGLADHAHSFRGIFHIASDILVRQSGSLRVLGRCRNGPFLLRPDYVIARPMSDR